MKKTLLCLLLILFAITSLYADEINRDKNDPLQNLKIGDKFTISKTTTENETTFDFTGLGLSDDMVGKVSLVAYYYPDNLETNQEIFSICFLDDPLDNYTFNWGGLSGIVKNITSNFFKQTIKHDEKNKTLLETPAKRVSLLFCYFPSGSKNMFTHSFCYILKGLNNGSGEVEIMGYSINIPHKQNIYDGDIDVKAPIQQ